MKKLFLLITITIFCKSIYAVDFFLNFNLGCNKSITQWSYAPEFKFGFLYGISSELLFNKERSSYIINLSYNSNESRVVVSSQYVPGLKMILGSENVYEHFSIGLGKSIYYKTKKWYKTNLYILAGIDYWGITQYSENSKLSNSSNVPLSVHWTSVYGSFDQKAFGANLAIKYARSFYLKSGTQMQIFGQMKLNFVSLPALGVIWQLNDQPEINNVSRHSPIQFNIGVGRQILKPKKIIASTKY